MRVAMGSQRSGSPSMGRGRWKGKMQMVDTYIDTYQVCFFNSCIFVSFSTNPSLCCAAKSYPDAQVAQSGFLESISPRTFSVFGGEISEVLALPLLWAVFVGTVSVNSSTISLLPFELGEEIRQKWGL